MNYYRRYLGDYMRDTMHISITEHGAYTLLLDGYYASEHPLPADYESLYRICRAMNKTEQDAVKKVVDRFFPVQQDGLRHNPRADHEIAVAQSTIEKQRKSGVESAAKRWGTDKVDDGLTHESAIQPPTTNHQPLIHQPSTAKETTTAPDASRRAPKMNGRRIGFDFAKGAFQGVSEEDELRWQEAYPAVPIPPAISQAAAWLKANPANRKENYERFLVNWFKRDQDKAARVRR